MTVLARRIAGLVLCIGTAECIVRILPLGDSITSGGGSEVYFMDPEEALTEARSIIEAIDADGSGMVNASVIREFLRHQDLPSQVLDDSGMYDFNSDGRVSADELASQIVPMIFGRSERAASYRQFLPQLLADRGLGTHFVGTACKPCGESPTCESDPWIYQHGCDQGYNNGYDHLSFWSWSGDNVANGNPSQPQRGKLRDWLEPGLDFDVALIHLGTNDLAQGRQPDSVVETLQKILDLLEDHAPTAKVFLAQIIPCRARSVDVSPLNTEIRQRFEGKGRVVVVDQFEGFVTARHTVDGVHPNAIGAKLMAQRWSEAIASEVLRSDSTPTNAEL